MKKIIFSLLIIQFSFLIANAQSGWFQVTTPINNLYLNRIQFTSQNTGYAIGPFLGATHGVLMKTVNGGTNWELIPIDSLWCFSIYFIDDNTGFTMGDGGPTPGDH